MPDDTAAAEETDVMHLRMGGAPARADSHHSRGTGDDTPVEPGRGSATGTPRWGTVLAIVIAVGLVLLLLVLHLTGVLGPGGH
jgi:hypothetical protein